VLNHIDLKRVAEKLGLEAQARRYLATAREYEHGLPQLVFEKRRVKTKPYRAGTKKIQRRSV
jgi:hypothetical protein